MGHLELQKFKVKLCERVCKHFIWWLSFDIAAEQVVMPLPSSLISLPERRRREFGFGHPRCSSVVLSDGLVQVWICGHRRFQAFKDLGCGDVINVDPLHLILAGYTFL